LKPRASQARKGVLACIPAAVAAIALVACGDEEAQTLTFTLSEQGKGTKVSGPSSAETGLAEITLENESDGEGDMQLIRVEGDHSPEEVIAGLEKAMKGRAFPEWFFGGGGVGILPAGESATVTQVLKPGTYYGIDTEGGKPTAGAIAVVDVSGDESDEELEEGDGTVTAIEYGFEADELPSGEVEVDFENGGAQPHHLIAAPLKGDATAADVEQAIKSEKGQPPIDEEGTQNTAVLEGGEGQVVTLDLEPGRYALLCFISDRQGGPPHALKGMVDEVEVK
jgi:hypothetical protein